MKIAVYAICKNERQFIDRWAKTVEGADEEGGHLATGDRLVGAEPVVGRWCGCRGA